MTPAQSIATASQLLGEAAQLLDFAESTPCNVDCPMVPVCREAMAASWKSIDIARRRLARAYPRSGSAMTSYANAVAVKEAITARLCMIRAMHGHIQSVDKAMENG